MPSPRIAARAVIVQDDQILLVNATPDRGDGKWCAPGGGVERGEDIKAALAREVFEETGLRVTPLDILAVSEFFDDEKDFHQIDLFFAARIAEGALPDAWEDTAGVVGRRGFFTVAQIRGMEVFPAFLKTGAWQKENDAVYRGYERK